MLWAVIIIYFYIFIINSRNLASYSPLCFFIAMPSPRLTIKNPKHRWLQYPKTIKTLLCHLIAFKLSSNESLRYSYAKNNNQIAMSIAINDRSIKPLSISLRLTKTSIMNPRSNPIIQIGYVFIGSPLYPALAASWASRSPCAWVVRQAWALRMSPEPCGHSGLRALRSFY